MSVQDSVVIATHNQHTRLRLVLAGVECQTVPRDTFEVVVVDDGCDDGTAEMLERWQDRLPLRVVALWPNRGRCAARNEGVRVSEGEHVALLDGDALPVSEWLQAMREQRGRLGASCLLCGGEWSLPKLEYVADPETGEPVREGCPSVLRKHILCHRQDFALTEEMVRSGFEGIHEAAVAGGYPFAELKTVHEQTAVLFAEHPGSPVGWMGFYPHNAMVPRAAFDEVGGFDEEIAFSEGWDLAYRLMAAGVGAAYVPEARTYHLYHHHGSSDPAKAREESVVRRQAVEHMVRKCGDRRLLLILMWQAGVWLDRLVPEELRIPDLVELHRRFESTGERELDGVEAVLERHPETILVGGNSDDQAAAGVGPFGKAQELG